MPAKRLGCASAVLATGPWSSGLMGSPRLFAATQYRGENGLLQPRFPAKTLEKRPFVKTLQPRSVNCPLSRRRAAARVSPMSQKLLLGHKVRRLRRESGLSQAQMAEQLGISPSYLNLIEHNQRPVTLTLLLKLGQNFGIDLQRFAEDDE